MANPRDVISFQGIREERTTYVADGVTIVYNSAYPQGAPDTMIGKAVTLSGNGIVALAADGDVVVGKLIHVEHDGKCAVADEGFLGLPAGTGAALTRGQKIVGALLVAAKGYIREVAQPGAAYAEAVADEASKGRGMIVDASVSTNVIVKL